MFFHIQRREPRGQVVFQTGKKIHIVHERAYVLLTGFATARDRCLVGHEDECGLDKRVAADSFRRFMVSHGEGTAKEARCARRRSHGRAGFHVIMADPSPDPAKSKSTESSRGKRDGFPSDEELLHELRLHGAKPPPPREISGLSRRTRDFLLIAGAGSAAIGFGIFRVLGHTEPGNAVKLALTGIAVFCGLLWFVFYGVMNRY